MRYLTFALILFLFSLSFSASSVEEKMKKLPFDPSTGKITYTEVIQVEGLSRDALYDAARSWIALNFKSAQHVLQMDDKASGKLICKGNFVIYTGNFMPTEHRISFSLTIRVKEGRYKYILTDFTSKAGVYDWGPLEDHKKRIMAQSMYPRTHSKASAFMASLKKHMSSATVQEDDNW